MCSLFACITFVLTLLFSISAVSAQLVHYNASEESNDLIEALESGKIDGVFEQTTFFEAEKLSLLEYASKVESLCNSISEVDENYLDESVKSHFYSKLIARIDGERKRLLMTDPNWSEFKVKFSERKLINKIEMRGGILFFVVEGQSGKLVGAYNWRD
jgi:hypothetical protein